MCITLIQKSLTPQPMGGGEAGGSCRPLPALVFCPLLKISLVNPYLKILVPAKLFVAVAPMKKKLKKISFTTSLITLKFGSKNRPWFEGLTVFSPEINT